MRLLTFPSDSFSSVTICGGFFILEKCREEFWHLKCNWICFICWCSQTSQPTLESFRISKHISAVFFFFSMFSPWAWLGLVSLSEWVLWKYWLWKQWDRSDYLPFSKRFRRWHIRLLNHKLNTVTFSFWHTVEFVVLSITRVVRALCL